MDAHTIKKALINYKKNTEIIERLNWRLTEMRTKLYEGGTSSVIKMPDGTPKDRSEVISDFVVKEHDMQEEIFHLTQEIDIADKFIEGIHKCKEIIVDKFVNGLSYGELSKKHGYSKTRLYEIITEEIENQSDL